MKHDRSNNTQAGFSRNDLLSLLALAAAATLATPFLITNVNARSVRIACMNHLKQIGLASRMWANEHGELFPWQVSTNAGGALELVASGGAYRQFLAMSNEMVSPRILACPLDKSRERAMSFFTDFRDDRNVSYFVGLDADATMPQTILSGDRSITGGRFDKTGLMEFDTPKSAAWSTGIHPDTGHVALADGSAHVATSRQLQTHLQSHFLVTNSARFLIPHTP